MIKTPWKLYVKGYKCFKIKYKIFKVYLYIIIKDILNILYLFKLNKSSFVNVLFYLSLSKIFYCMFSLGPKLFEK